MIQGDLHRENAVCSVAACSPITRRSSVPPSVAARPLRHTVSSTSVADGHFWQGVLSEKLSEGDLYRSVSKAAGLFHPILFALGAVGLLLFGDQLSSGRCMMPFAASDALGPAGRLFVTFHTFRVMSALPLTIRRPSGLNDTQ